MDRDVGNIKLQYLGTLVSGMFMYKETSCDYCVICVLAVTGMYFYPFSDTVAIWFKSL